jgi:hypothetical protein
MIFDSYDMSPVFIRNGEMRPQFLVLFHRERIVARRGPGKQL